ncbi:hypothetical protein E3N88_03789 [Mikania micrantha]|uniref:Uncharacterized protein n=1 Tax=Mikania micrantha TaxID=192012 RepID=A0A5N6PUT8_9ASTR|nr:hypothetical protein E3N88_03789 [Mikania micrantha]
MGVLSKECALSRKNIDVIHWMEDIGSMEKGKMVEERIMGRKNAVEKPQSRQLKPKQTRVKQSKAEGNGKQVGGKSKDKEKQVEKVKVALEKIKIRPKWYQNMVSLLQNHIGNDWATHLHYSIAAGMFPTENSNVARQQRYDRNRCRKLTQGYDATTF